MKTFTFLCLILASLTTAQATHLLGGYIKASPISANSYQITTVLYMDEIRGKAAADQAESVQVCFGDGSTGIAIRSSRVFTNDKTTSINSYSIIHTYTGPGTYSLIVSVPNRTVVKNIISSDNQLLTLRTILSTTAALTNETPIPGFPQNGFRIGANQKAIISLNATDTNGDSLAYGLAKPLTSINQSACDAKSVTTYQFPNDLTRQGTFKINSRTGELTWDAPTELGYYSVAISIAEYRAGNLVSQTIQEITLLVEDMPGTPGTIPAYEPAIEGVLAGIVTATSNYEDTNFRLTTFPNPVDDQLQAVIQTSNLSTAVLQLMDINGRKLRELTFNRLARRHEQIISISDLTPGVYLVHAIVGDRILTRKIVKR